MSHALRRENQCSAITRRAHGQDKDLCLLLKMGLGKMAASMDVGVEVFGFLSQRCDATPELHFS